MDRSIKYSYKHTYTKSLDKLDGFNASLGMFASQIANIAVHNSPYRVNHAVHTQERNLIKKLISFCKLPTNVTVLAERWCLKLKVQIPLAKWDVQLAVITLKVYKFYAW